MFSHVFPSEIIVKTNLPLSVQPRRDAHEVGEFQLAIRDALSDRTVMTLLLRAFGEAAQQPFRGVPRLSRRMMMRLYVI